MRKTCLVGGFLLTIILSLSSSVAQTTQAQTKVAADAPTASEPPTPPRTPPPNKTRPGGGLNPARHACDRLDNSLRALVPVENPVFTASTHPTFLFYVPYTASEIQYGQFSILTWPDETQRIGKIDFTLPPETPGIVSVTLPKNPEFALQEDRYYHWYFQLFCPGNESLQADLEVNGWVLRTSTQSKSALQSEPIAAEIWYDMLAELALQLQASPQDEALNATWNALMQRIGLEAAIKADFSGAIILPRQLETQW
ncbi:MAG: DUF928 domain-containing protein [Cyanobacteria bacterium J06641_5]